MLLRHHFLHISLQSVRYQNWPYLLLEIISIILFNLPCYLIYPYLDQHWKMWTCILIIPNAEQSISVNTRMPVITLPKPYVQWSTLNHILNLLIREMSLHKYLYTFLLYIGHCLMQYTSSLTSSSHSWLSAINQLSLWLYF